MAKRRPRVRRTFTPQFKKDALALVRDGRSVTEVAHDLALPAACSSTGGSSWVGTRRRRPSPEPAAAGPRRRRCGASSSSCARSPRSATS